MLRSSNLNAPTNAKRATPPKLPRNASNPHSSGVFRNTSRPSGTTNVASNARVVWVIPRNITAVDTASPPYAVAYRTSKPDAPKKSAANAINSNPAVSSRGWARSVLSSGRRSGSVCITAVVDVLNSHCSPNEIHVLECGIR